MQYGRFNYGTWSGELPAIARLNGEANAFELVPSANGGIAGFVIDDQVSLVLPDVTESASYFAEVDGAEASPAMAVPMSSSQAIVLRGRSRGQTFSGNDLQYLPRIGRFFSSKEPERGRLRIIFISNRPKPYRVLNSEY